MKCIHKQTINLLNDRYAITVPASARVLSVQMQPWEYVLASVWYEFDDVGDKQEKLMRFAILNTGDSYETANLKYLATIQLNNGRFIRHVYEIH